MSRFLPVDADAEAAILGAMLTSPDALADALEELDADSFGVVAHAEIFRAAAAVDAAGRVVDALTVAAELRRTRRLGRAGGEEAIGALVEAASQPGSVVSHAAIVSDLHLKRRLLDAGKVISAEALAEGVHGTEVLEVAEREVFEIGNQRGRSSLVEMPVAVAATMESLANTRGKLLVGTSTGYDDLDRLTAGFQGGQLIVLAARPGMGKSALALQLAANLAVNSGGLTVPFLSFEMSTEELVGRLISARLRYDLRKLRTGDMPAEMDRDVAAVAEDLSQLSLMIDDNPPETISGMRSAMRRLARRTPLGAIVIDYVQLMSGEGRGRDENRVQELSNITRGLKRLATELDVPIIALSQLNRALEARPNKRPQLSDLRESGCLSPRTRLLTASGEEVEIGELYRTGARNVPVVCFDEDGKRQVGNLTHAFSSGTKTLYRVRTASGHEVEATANHPFLTINGWVPLGELGVGSRVAAPRDLGHTGASLPDWDESRLGLCAHLIGDGCVLAKQPAHYTNADPENLDYVEEQAHKLGLRTSRVRQGNVTHLYMARPGSGRSKGPLREWLEPQGLWDKRAHEKFVPAQVFSLPTQDVAHFLRHLWATDGSLTMDTKGTVHCYYSTSSRQLADDVKLLLLRFGIVGRIFTVDYGHRARTGYQVVVSGSEHQIIFCEEIGVHGQRGRLVPVVLEDLRSRTSNPNRDTVPIEIWDHVRPCMAAKGITTREYARRINSTYGGTAHFKFSPTRRHLSKVMAATGCDVARKWANSDLYWDEIVGIIEIGEEEVFDATVETYHNFVANGLVLHNSLEQDANLVLMLYREALYSPDADPTLSELIVAKQRNGPTGTIYLDWEGSCALLSTTKRTAPPAGAGGGRFGSQPF